MTPSLRKTTLDVDGDLLECARQILGTHGIEDTIHRALQEVVIADARRWNIEYLRALDPTSPDELRQRAWIGEQAP